MRLTAATVFLGAFLLFQVQPVIGKAILPWFGSTPAVWTACLLVFQILLLAGYAYAHFSVSRLSPRGQAVTHLVLLGLVLLLLPITPSESWRPGAGDDPTWRIVLLLVVTVGGPFFLLSSTGPLLQGWFARMKPGRSPYRLYALGNVGSLLALISYPLFFERHLRLADQTLAWSIGWAVYAVIAALCALRFLRSPGEVPKEEGENEDVERPRLGSVVLWVAFAACGSGMLMATTNHLCQDVAVIPLLWVVPLGVYLLSFIICFDRERWYVRPLFYTLLIVALGGAVYGIAGGVDLSIGPQIGLGTFALFICCMCCHGELVRRKPHPRHLTAFYLAVSGGGALGGFFVAIVSPAVFSGFLEYPLLLLLCYGLVSFSVLHSAFSTEDGEASSRWSRAGTAMAWATCGALVLLGTLLYFTPSRWPWLEPGDDVDPEVSAVLRGSGYALLLVPIFVLVVVNGPLFWRRKEIRRWRSPRFLARPALLLMASVAFIPLTGVLVWHRNEARDRVIDQVRNFYGVLRLKEYSPGTDSHDYTLIHGRINHGSQFLKAGYRAWPTSYYGVRSGLGLAIRFHPERHREGRQFRIGVVGLGAGTIAAYASAEALPVGDSGPPIAPFRSHPGDAVTFYEINPLVSDWAEKYFTYLSDAAERGATVEVRLGDARVVMERQLERGEPQGFDILAIDAFSGDAVPVHLLTAECIKVYLAHIREDGVLAFHITNRYLWLAPVVERLARENGLVAVLVEDEADPEYDLNSTDWVLVTRNLECLRRAGLEVPTGIEPAAGPLWTDDFSSLLSVLK